MHCEVLGLVTLQPTIMSARMLQSAAEETVHSLSLSSRKNQEHHARHGCRGSSILACFFMTSIIKLERLFNPFRMMDDHEEQQVQATQFVEE
mmetsp:Transcript_23941/g.35557  ORF Transcript_23941/g.35557 Transcript_23941/m.35557 type:complete len:92 (-) Transcript_23941:67-342(-)